MSKKYKNKICVYCIRPNSSETGDHIVAKAFFLPENRENLPQVPACKKCNNEKSKLEHYLATILPFGGTHADAGKTLREQVKPRLEKNVKLRNKLVADLTKGLRISSDANTLLKLSEFIAKGLAYHHWQIYLPTNHFYVMADYFVDPDLEMGFEGDFSLESSNRVQGDLGGAGVFVYKGVQAEDCREATAWRMSFYGMEIKPGRDPTKRCKYLYVITGTID